MPIVAKRSPISETAELLLTIPASIVVPEKTVPRKTDRQRSDSIGRTVFSERELTLFAVARPSVCRLSSVTFVRPTQAVHIFGNISTALGTLAIREHPLKISRRSAQGTPPPGELNVRGVAKYSDFGPIDGSRI